MRARSRIGAVLAALILAPVLPSTVATAPAAQRDTVSFPTDDGGIVWADVWGEGPRGLVLAHGGRFTKESWADQGPAFAAAGFRVVAIDFRGRGRSRGGPGGDGSDEGYALDVLAAVRHLRETGADSVAVVGASFGGWAAARAAVEAPGAIDRLVVLAAGVDEPERLTLPKLFIIARDDPDNRGEPRLASIRPQFERAPEPKELVVLEGEAHAQFLFDTDQGERLLQEILRFLAEPGGEDPGPPAPATVEGADPDLPSRGSGTAEPGVPGARAVEPASGPGARRQGPDTPEPGSIDAIARETSEPRFLGPWVSYVPESETVPSPSDVLGHVAGAAGELPDSAAVYGYMRRLADASERVHVEVMGTSEEGREILLVAIADEEGIRRLPELKAASAALADPRVTGPDEVEEVVAGARPFYFLNGAIHADESVAPDMLMELAYRLAVSEQPFIRGIREETVVLINPVANPDGRDKMSDWFRRHHRGRGIEDYGDLPRQSPPYWGKYVFVDANRDAHQLELATTQAVARMFFEYHPVVIHDLHEAIPLLLTWNGTGPYNPNLDPIVWSEFLEMSFHEMSTLSAMGMPGVWTWNFGEGFGHHYTDSIAMNHNAIGRGYETFGNAVPLALTRDLEGQSTTREWYRPIPPPAEPFTWSHRDGLNYSQTAALSALDYTARNARQLLRAFWAKGHNSWQRGVAGDPYAFAIPAEQGDRRRVARMIGRLEKQGIEVHRAVDDFEVAGRSFLAGDFVVRLDQPYRNYAVDLLLPQEFPDDAEHEPYDDTSWAFPLHFGVEAVRVDDAAILDVALEPVEGTPDVTGRVIGWGEASGAGGAPGPAAGQESETGPAFLLRDTGQEALLAARYRLAEFDVSIAEEPFVVERRRAGAGSWILPPQAGLRDALEGVAEELALDFEILEAAPAPGEPPRHAAPAPRIGVWVPWADTDMIGWIRLILDREGIPYTYLRDEDVRAGGLGERVDVIVYGTVLLDLAAQIHGIDPDDGPLAFTATDEYPSLGTPAASEDITGGIGWEGLAELEAFVRGGGLLVTLGNGSTLALEGGLIRHVARADLPGTTTPGVHMRAEFLQPDHPVAYGYPRITVAFRSPYALYDPPRSWLTMSYCTSCLDGPVDLEHVVMQWGTRPFVPSAAPTVSPTPETPEEELPLVVSGGGRNTEAAQGRPAVLDVPLGEGRIVAFNFNPMHRDMNRADHRYLWNVLLNWEFLVSDRREVRSRVERGRDVGRLETLSGGER